MPESSTRRVFLGSSLLAAGLAATNRAAAQETKAPPPSAPARIAKVEALLLKTDLKRPFGVSVSVPLDKTRTTLLVRIETDTGVVGWGETAGLSGTKQAIEQLGTRLVGKNPLEHRLLWRTLWGANFGNPLAVGGLDIALQDLRGKLLGLPVHMLYGGRLRDRVPAYASAMNYVEGEDPGTLYPREAAALVKSGYRALKMRLGRYPVSREAKVARAVREAVGPDVRLMVDGNAAYTLGSALQMGEVLHDLQFDFFEEPLPQVAPHYAGYEELRNKLPLPLAGGEGLDARASAKELIDRRAFHIIQPDISLCGGFGEVLFIAEMAALSGIPCVPHCWGSAILIAATTHLVSLLPDPHWGFPTDTPMVEYDQSENPWRTEIVEEPITVKEGFIQVSDAPGLGLTIREEVVRKYAV